MLLPSAPVCEKRRSLASRVRSDQTLHYTFNPMRAGVIGGVRDVIPSDVGARQ